MKNLLKEDISMDKNWHNITFTLGDPSDDGHGRMEELKNTIFNVIILQKK